MIWITLTEIGFRRMVDTCDTAEEALERLRLMKQRLLEEVKIMDIQIKCIEKGKEDGRYCHRETYGLGVNCGLPKN